MASYMSTFRKRIKKMEQQGFVIPRYIKEIKREKTARKYTVAEIAKRSKFEEDYKGKKRLISGEAGLEKIRSASARKAAETRKRKQKQEDEVQKWKERKEALKRNIYTIFNTFASRRLANMIQSLFDKREAEYGDVFWAYILSQSSEVIEQLQEDALIPSSDRQLQDDAYADWVQMLNFGEAQTQEEREEIAEIADEEVPFNNEEM